MRALSRLPPAQGIAAMNSINVVAVTPVFMTTLFGAGVACVLLAVMTLFSWETAGARYKLAGAVLYLVGTILVTIVFNVPQNDALAAVNPENADGARMWSGYVSVWTRWNHVRTIAALAAAASLTIGLCLSYGERTGAP
jgi:uncharacterized membrane protein